MKTNNRCKFTKSLVMWMLLTSGVFVQAQKDSSFSVTRNGVVATFPFRVYHNDQQMKAETKQTFPAYAFDGKQLYRINQLLVLFTQNENDFDKWKLMANQKDSILQTKITLYQKSDSLQQLRAQNFENSYKSLLVMNQKYDAELKACEQLAVDTKRMQTKNTIMVGAGALALGLLLGLIVR
jgi:hypothetical protein